MPLYEFVCRDCGREQEILIRGSETPECESCGGGKLAKLLSTPIAHVAGASAPRPEGGSSGGCGAHCGCHPH
jgi:putative FmdB family regulatory protein